MALSFASNSTDRVNCGSAFLFDNTNAGTIIVRFRTTSFDATNWGSFLTKGDQTYVIYKGFDLTNAGAISFEWSRATVSLLALSADGLITTDTDYFLAVVYNSAGANADQKIYLGAGTSPAAEIGSYVTQQVGSGAVHDDAVYNCVLGNLANGSAIQCGGNRIISFVGWWNTAFDLNAILRQQYNRFPTFGCVGFWELGWPDTTVTDRSGNGNNGTVTGATAANHAPTLTPFHHLIQRHRAYAVGGSPAPVYLKRGGMFFGA